MRHSQFCKLLTIAAIAISCFGHSLNARVSKKPVSKLAPIQIKKVTYGGVSQFNRKNFITLLKNAIGNANSYTLPNKKYPNFSSLFGDPKRGVKKELIITYSVNGKPGQTVSIYEWSGNITLGSQSPKPAITPEPKSMPAPEPTPEPEVVLPPISVVTPEHETVQNPTDESTSNEEMIAQREPTQEEMNLPTSSFAIGDRTTIIIPSSKLDRDFLLWVAVAVTDNGQLFHSVLSGLFLLVFDYDRENHKFTPKKPGSPNLTPIQTNAPFRTVYSFNGRSIGNLVKNPALLCRDNNRRIYRIKISPTDSGAYFVVTEEKDSNGNPIVYVKNSNKLTRREWEPCFASDYILHNGYNHNKSVPEYYDANFIFDRG